MATVKEDPNSPWPTYFMMGAGACIAASALLGNGLGVVGILKIAVGLGSIIYGIWKLSTGKKTS